MYILIEKFNLHVSKVSSLRTPQIYAVIKYGDFKGDC
jgi:hypothetical protein